MAGKTNCFINFLKPAGMSSHDAVNAVRKIFSEKKTGHLGTLDPGAAGVLPIACGPAAVRLIEYLPEKTKGYRAEITLGMRSTSGDMYGEITHSAETAAPSGDDVAKALREFEGRQMQVPPAASALKLNGMPLYAYFRKGIEIDVPAREIEIFSIKLISYSYPRLIIDTECSGGTYIRSLVRDIGECLGCGGVMSYLVRTRSGRFHLSESLTMEELAERKNEISSFSVSMSEAMESYREIKADEKLMKKVSCGNEFEYPEQSCEGEIFRITDPSGDLAAVGICSPKDGKNIISCKKVFTGLI